MPTPQSQLINLYPTIHMDLIFVIDYMKHTKLVIKCLIFLPGWFIIFWWPLG